jgi:hypothetical protein
MEYLITESQYNLLVEVVKDKEYSDEFHSRYYYTDILVYPRKDNKSVINTVIFTGPVFGKTEFKPNTYNQGLITFEGTLGDFTFEAKDVFTSLETGAPFVYSKSLRPSEYNKLKHLIKTPKDSVSGLLKKLDYKSKTDSSIAHPNYVKQIIGKLGRWLGYELGLTNIVDKILSPIKNEISQEDISKYIEGAKILRNNGNITDKTYKWFVNEVLSGAKLVYDKNGNWHPVNKLNTNPGDLTQLLTDILFKSYESGDLESEEILRTISNTTSSEKIKKILLTYKDKLMELFLNNLDSPKDLFKYVESNVKDSEKGEGIENSVKEKFESLGYKTIYQGGNGDFVDMKFSVDLILKGKNDIIKTVQVKSNENQVKEFINNYEKGRHQAVDLVIYPDKNLNNIDIYKIYDTITRETKTILT